MKKVIVYISLTTSECQLHADCVSGGSVAVASAAGSSALTVGVGHPARAPSSVATTSADTVRTSNSVSYGFICYLLRMVSS